MPTGITSWLIATDYTTIQNAVNSVPPTGGVVYIPEGTYNSTSPTKFTPDLVLPNDRPVSILGAGANATILSGTSSAGAMVTLTGDYQSIEGLTLNGNGTTAGTGKGIVIGSAGRAIRRAKVVDCIVTSTSAWALQVLGTTDSAGSFAIECSVLRTEFRFTKNTAYGAARVGVGCTTIYLQESAFENSAGYLVDIEGAAGVTLLNCVLEKSSTITDDSRPFLHLNGAFQCVVTSCWFEQTTVLQQYPFIAIDGVGRNHTCSACSFHRSTTNPRVLSVNASTPGVVVISPDIEVIDPPSALDHFAVNGAGTEFILIGGKIATSAAYYTPKIQALASLIQYGEYPHVRIAAANSMTLRVPAIASAGVAAPVKGDLIFNNTNGKGQMYDGVVWRDLW